MHCSVLYKVETMKYCGLLRMILKLYVIECLVKNSYQEEKW